jgi:hypothetical protein
VPQSSRPLPIDCIRSSSFLSVSIVTSSNERFPLLGLVLRWVDDRDVDGCGVCIELCVLNCLYWIVCIELCVLDCVYWIVCIELCVLNCVYWIVCIELCVLNCVCWIVCVEVCVLNCVY